MTATAQQVLEEIRRLPAADVRELCQAVLQLAAQAGPTPIPAQDNGAAPVDTEGDDDANEASFFAALEELRQLGTIRPGASGLED